MPVTNYENAVDRNDHVDHSNSHGLRIPTLPDQWVPLLLAAWDNDIVTVCAGPNHGERLGDKNPQRFGRADNPLITVGSLESDGTVSAWNGIEGPATSGSETGNPNFRGHIDIYAIGEDLALPFSNTYLISASATRAAANSWEHDVAGASFSAAQIAALSSYFASSPQFATIPPGNVAMDRKTQIVKLSRTDPTYDSQRAASNGVREVYCDASINGDLNAISTPPRAQQ